MFIWYFLIYAIEIELKSNFFNLVMIKFEQKRFQSVFYFKIAYHFGLLNEAFCYIWQKKFGS